MSKTTTAPSPRKDLWIPALFVLFFVGLAILQGWFVMLAQSSFTGIVTDQTHRSAEIGPAWTADIAFEATGPHTGKVWLRLGDEEGAPIIPDRILATAERGTRFPQSLPIAFKVADDGVLTADLDLPLAGEWTLRVIAFKEGQSFETITTVELET